MRIKKLFGMSIPIKALIFSMPILILIIIDTIYTMFTYSHIIGQNVAYIFFPGVLILIYLDPTFSGLHSIDPIRLGIVTCLFYYLFMMVVLFILKKIKVILKSR